MGISNNDAVDGSAAVYEQPNASPGELGQLGQPAGEGSVDELRGRNPTPIQGTQFFVLMRLEASGVTMERFHVSP